jgi:hypothetical protein
MLAERANLLRPPIVAGTDHSHRLRAAIVRRNPAVPVSPDPASHIPEIKVLEIKVPEIEVLEIKPVSGRLRHHLIARYLAVR